jgi:hypothetical protein
MVSPVKGRALIPIARLLAQAAGRTPNEPAARSSVNRAYYAAFGEASDYATRVGYSSSAGAGSHSKVWNYIGAHSDGDAVRDATRRAVASQGLFLKARRHKADYQRTSRMGRTDHDDALKESARIIQTLDSL